MSSNEESQTNPTLSDIMNPEKNVKPQTYNIRMSREVNEKITELLKETC